MRDRYLQELRARHRLALSRPPGQRPAGDHHLRRHARLPAADERSPSRPCARRSRVAVEHYRAPLRPPAARHLAARVRLPARASTSCSRRGHRYFFIDTHGVALRRAAAALRRLRPGPDCPSGVAAFGRDLESVQAGLERRRGLSRRFRLPRVLPRRRLRPRLRLPQAPPRTDGIRKNTGHQVLPRSPAACDLHEKELYDPGRGRASKAAEHAGNFMFNREKQVEWLAGAHGAARRSSSRPTTPSSSATGGSRGPTGSTSSSARCAYDQQTVDSLITPREYLERAPDDPGAPRPALSSWGYKGYCEVWLDGTNDWIYRHLHEAADRMVELADAPPRRRRRPRAAAP